MILTDDAGLQIDTFVIADTDRHTGLTHINYGNLKVGGDRLKLHVKTTCGYHMPIADSFSFEMIRKLRDKYVVQDAFKMATVSHMPEISIMANAS